MALLLQIPIICTDILSTWQYIRRYTELPEFFFFTLFFHFWLHHTMYCHGSCLSTYSDMIKKSTVPNLGVIAFAHTRIYRDVRVWEVRFSYISVYTEYINVYWVYQRIYDNGVFIQGVRFPDEDIKSMKILVAAIYYHWSIFKNSILIICIIFQVTALLGTLELQDSAKRKGHFALFNFLVLGHTKYNCVHCTAGLLQSISSKNVSWQSSLQLCHD